jgi:hypothetical protein
MIWPSRMFVPWARYWSVERRQHVSGCAEYLEGPRSEAASRPIAYRVPIGRCGGFGLAGDAPRTACVFSELSGGPTRVDVGLQAFSLVVVLQGAADRIKVDLIGSRLNGANGSAAVHRVSGSRRGGQVLVSNLYRWW